MQTLKNDRCQFCFVFLDSIHSELMLIKKSLKFKQNKNLQKVFTLHYWRFFFFKFKYFRGYFVLLWYVYDLAFWKLFCWETGEEGGKVVSASACVGRWIPKDLREKVQFREWPSIGKLWCSRPLRALRCKQNLWTRKPSRTLRGQNQGRLEGLVKITDTSPVCTAACIASMS